MPAMQDITSDVAVMIRMTQAELFQRDEEKKKRGGAESRRGERWREEKTKRTKTSERWRPVSEGDEVRRTLRSLTWHQPTLDFGTISITELDPAEPDRLLVISRSDSDDEEAFLGCRKLLSGCEYGEQGRCRKPCDSVDSSERCRALRATAEWWLVGGEGNLGSAFREGNAKRGLVSAAPQRSMQGAYCRGTAK